MNSLRLRGAGAIICCLFSVVALTGCGGGSSPDNGGGAGLTLSSVSGQVLAPSVVGPETPVPNATVRLVRVDNQGDMLAEIASGTTDSQGNFTLKFPSLLVRANIWLTASGGAATRPLVAANRAGYRSAAITSQFFSTGLASVLTDAIARISPATTAATQILQERLQARGINLADVDSSVVNNYKQAALVSAVPLPPAGTATSAAVADARIKILAAIAGNQNVALQLNYIVQLQAFGERIFYFTGFTGTQHGVHSMRPDGSGDVFITAGEEPDVSPDGSKLAFVVSPGFPHPSQLVVANSDGSNPQVVFSRENLGVGSPAWAPDNKRIAFEANGQIWVVDTARGNTARKITGFGVQVGEGGTVDLDGNSSTVGPYEGTKTAATTFNIDPDWLPGGNEIVFATDRHSITVGGSGSGNANKRVDEVYRVNLNTLVQTRITKQTSGTQVGASFPVTSPNVSPNGQTIVFGRTAGLFTIPSNTVVPFRSLPPTSGRETKLATYNVRVHSLSYSPDGQHLAVSLVDGKLIVRGATPGTQESNFNGLNPSWATLPSPTAPPAPGPTPTPVPTTVPTTGPQTVFFTAPGGRIVTVRLNGNDTSTVFPDLLEAGDHDESGHKTVQGFVGFPLSGLPTDPTRITNVRLVLTENRDSVTGTVGQPFSQLGRPFVERITQSEFQQITTTQLATSDITRTSALVLTNASGVYVADATGIFKEFVRTGQSVANFRLRFETLENNDGGNDLADFFITGTSQPRLEVTFTP